MARRTKAAIAREKAVDEACQKATEGLIINVMDIGKISKAAEVAYDAGTDAYAAARTVAIGLHQIPGGKG